MAEAITTDDLQSVHEATTALRTEVKALTPRPEVLQRVNVVLDEYEAKSAELVSVRAVADNAKADIAEAKSLFAAALEKSNLTVVEQKGRLDALELVLANEAEQRSKTADYHDGAEYKALHAYVCQGALVDAEVKALLRTDNNSAGGYLVTSEMDNVIQKEIVEIDPIRGFARVRTIGGKSIELVTRNSLPVALFEGEAEAGTQSASSYRNETVTPFRHTFTTPVTMDQLQDSAFNMESEITSDASTAFALGEGQNFVSGDGHKKPEGFTVNADILAAKVLGTGPAGGLTVGAQDLLTLQGKLKPGYNGSYTFNKATHAHLRGLRADAVSAADGAGLWLWAPALDGNSAPTIAGRPYFISESMDALGSESISIAYGDFRAGYTIVDRTGLSVIRDDVTQKAKAIVEFTFNRWLTGQVTLAEAILVLEQET